MNTKITKRNLRLFLYILGFIFLFISFYPLFNNKEILNWALICSILFILTGIIRPDLSRGIYSIWIKFGEVIGTMVSKIVLIIIFFSIFTPIAFVRRIMHKVPFDKQPHSDKNSYWIKREIQPGSLKNQF